MDRTRSFRETIRVVAVGYGSLINVLSRTVAQCRNIKLKVIPFYPCENRMLRRPPATPWSLLAFVDGVKNLYDVVVEIAH